MPRKKTIQPEPLDRFYLEDGTEVVIIDETCWPIGRGQHFAKEFEKTVQGFILEKLGDDLLNPDRAKKVATYMETPTRFASQVAAWGLLGEYGNDDTHVRKHWYPKINKVYNTLMRALAEKPDHRLTVRLMPKQGVPNKTS